MRATLATALILALSDDPAVAQVAGSLSVATDLRFRGRSATGGGPVAAASLTYDDRSGLYVSGYGVVAKSDGGGIAPRGGQVNIGYAWRMGDTLSLDIGMLRTRWRPHRRAGTGPGYDELYAGRSLAAYLHVAPAARRSMPG